MFACSWSASRCLATVITALAVAVLPACALPPNSAQTILLDLWGSRSTDLPGALSKFAAVTRPDAFSGRLVWFEFASARGLVIDKTSISLPTTGASAYGGERGHPLPVVEANVAGAKVTVVLDPASREGLQLPMELSNQVPLKGPLVSTGAVRMLGVEHAAFNGRIAGTVHIGPLTLTDPDVQFVEGMPIANAGLQILMYTTLVLDPENQRSWLLPAVRRLI